jgi:hypothetical protein
MISVVTLPKDFYSASVFDRDTVGCFLALQETRLEPRKTAKPPVDMLSSTQQAQSASKKPLTSIDGERVICKPMLTAPLTYRRTLFAVVVRCNVVGACKNWQILFIEKLMSG